MPAASANAPRRARRAAILLGPALAAVVWLAWSFAPHATRSHSDFVATEKTNFSDATRPSALSSFDAGALAPTTTPTPAPSFTSTLATFRQRLGPSPTPDETMAALHALAASDPALAIDLAHALGSTDEEKNTWVTALAAAWAERTPQAAWDWLAQLEPARIRTLATGTLPATIVDTLARRDPQLLLANVDRLARAGESSLGVPPVVAVHLGVEALAATAQLDLARTAVERWARDPARPAIGESAYVAVASALAASAPAHAGAWLQALPPSAERDTALVEFPAQWAQRDPRAALDWAAAHLPAELRPHALQRAFSDWVEAAPADAGEWLGRHLAHGAAGPETDRLIASVINLSAPLRHSPDTALQWTRLVSDPALRRTQEERIALRWARQDPHAAASYIANSSTLDPARKQSLLQQLAAPLPPDHE